MYISPSSPFTEVKMSPSLTPHKFTDFASFEEKSTSKICEFAILRSLDFVRCEVARDIYWRYL